MLQAGVRVIQSLDIDMPAVDCMRMNPGYFGHDVLHEDISQKLVLNQPKSDIVIGTYPCTKYSAIADIHGTRTGDDLYLHFFRHLAIELPEAYVLENVPGMKKFKVVMEAMTKLPQYYVTVFCPVDATNWLPQRRRRLIVIGTKKAFSISHPAAESGPRIADIIERDPGTVEMPGYVLKRIKGGYRDRPIIVDPSDPKAVAPTCVAHYAKDLGTRLVVDKNCQHGLRPFTVREYARLQGFPDDFKFPESRVSYKLIGNAVPVPMGRWVGRELMKYFN